MQFSPPRNGNAAVVCREISGPDLPAVVDLLGKGFAALRSPAFWARAMERLSRRSPPAGFPRFGYVLARGETLVGVLLLIASEAPDGDGVRCNVSSWYVEPEFRPYGTLLVHQALRRREATYLNVTAAPETWPVLAAQGYVRYATGRAIAVPALAWAPVKATVTLAGPELQPGEGLSAAEARLLLEHSQWDCLSLICRSEGKRLPFVFGVRRRCGMLPFGYLIYCRDLSSLVDHARPIGRFLAGRGIAMVVADADGPLAGMPGWFRDGHPKYFKGRHPPRPGDLAYTERAIFGV